MTRHPSSEGEVEEDREAREDRGVWGDQEEVVEEEVVVGVADEEVRGVVSPTNWL